MKLAQAKANAEPPPATKEEAKAVVKAIAEKANTPERMVAKNYPFITFVARNWLLLVSTAAAMLATKSEWLFLQFGSLIYIVAAGLMCASTAFLIVHLFWRQSIDLDISNGRYLIDWDALTPKERIQVHTQVKIGLLIGLAIVAASVAK